MVNASLLIQFSLSPLKQDWLGTISGRTLKLFLPALPFTPQGSEATGLPTQDVPSAREMQVVFANCPVMVRALPVATLTTVLVSHPPAKPFMKALWPSKVGRL